MKLKGADFDIDIVECTKPRKWFPHVGWYWQEVRLPPSGPFSSIGDALRNLTDKIESGELIEAVDTKEAARRCSKPPS